MAKKELDRFDTKAKRNMRISTKLMLFIGAGVVISSIGVCILSLGIFNSKMIDNTIEDLNHTADGVELYITSRENDLSHYSKLFARNSELLNAIEYDSSYALQHAVKSFVDDSEIDFMFVTDSRGRVLKGGGVNVTDGVDVSYIGTVANALSGEPSIGIEGVANFNYAIIASEPIYINGKIFGTVVTGYDLSTNHIIDYISRSYNVECTVLKNDIRTATTLTDSDGNSLAGTKLDDSFVEETVLHDGNAFAGPVDISGRSYYGYYFPITSGDGKITGMFFIAKNIDSIEAVRAKTGTIVIPVVCILCALIITIGGFFVRWLMWRISNVTNTLKDMASGDADLTKRVKLLIRDEIGDLVIQFDFFCDKLQQIVGEIKNSKENLYSAGSQMSETTTETSSSISNIIQNLSNIRNQISFQNDSVHQTADSVSEISNSITALNDMIEKQVNGVNEATAAVEEMVGNIASVNTSVDKMAVSFEELTANAQAGFSKQQDVNDQITSIEGQSKMLQEANSVIASIAEQTNLLAMNAAIEAAHAGEAGKGFSVVADEIRKLSETSSLQSKTIGEQLDKIRDSITNVVSSATESGKVLALVSNKIHETNQLVVQIKGAMNEQQIGSEQIVLSLKDMNESTNNVRSSSKQMEDRNEKIMNEINSLKEITVKMRDSMSNMSEGAERISAAEESLSDISHKVKDSIDKIGSEIDLFKI